MGSISYFAALVFCLVVVEAFPRLRRRDEYGYEIFSHKRCVPPPPDTVCKLDYKISSAMIEADTLKSVESSIMFAYQNVAKDCPACAEEYKKLFCRQVFPTCLPGGLLDYGNRKQAVASCKDCVYGEGFLMNLNKTGLHRDPAALVCRQVPQDKGKVCPKPRYKMLSTYADIYEAQVQNVVRKMDEEKDEIPSECYQMGLEIFGCSGVYCSQDGESIFMTTTMQKCFSIGVCLKKHHKYTDEARAMLNEACPKYPDERKAKRIKL